jgi:multiple antibiotic resistance protein
MLEAFSIKETMTCFMVLFAVIDILGSVPIIVSLRKQFGHIDSERASIVSGGLMIVFFFRRQNAEIHWYRC